MERALKTEYAPTCINMAAHDAKNHSAAISNVKHLLQGWGMALHGQTQCKAQADIFNTHVELFPVTWMPAIFKPSTPLHFMAIVNVMDCPFTCHSRLKSPSLIRLGPGAGGALGDAAGEGRGTGTGTTALGLADGVGPACTETQNKCGSSPMERCYGESFLTATSN